MTHRASKNSKISSRSVFILSQLGNEHRNEVRDRWENKISDTYPLDTIVDATNANSVASTSDGLDLSSVSPRSQNGPLRSSSVALFFSSLLCFVACATFKRTLTLSHISSRLALISASVRRPVPWLCRPAWTCR